MGNAPPGTPGVEGEGHPACAIAGKKVVKVQLAATPILEVAGVKAYHTSILIGRNEYFFDADGIVTAPALWSHTGLDGKSGEQRTPRERRGGPNTEIVEAGVTPVSAEAFMASMKPFFPAGSYDIILKNCNSFSDAALYFLTRTRMEGRFSRLERLLAAARPVSTRLVAAALRGSQMPMGYSINPLAEDFRVEDVIAACDATDVARWGRKNKTSGVLCGPNLSWGIPGCHGCCQACEVDMDATATSVVHAREYAPDAAEASLEPDSVARAAELLSVHAHAHAMAASLEPDSVARAAELLSVHAHAHAMAATSTPRPSGSRRL